MASRWTSRPLSRLPMRLPRAPRRYIGPQPKGLHTPFTHQSRLANPGLPFRCFTTSLRRHESNIVVRVPPMAESITEGTLSQFSKSIGDFIEMDEEFATIETDKIDVSVNATQSGIIQQLLVAEGDVVTVDQAIAEIQPGDKHVKNLPKEDSPKPSPTKGEEQHSSTQTTQPSIPSSPTEHVASELPKDTPEREASKHAASAKNSAPSQTSEVSHAFQGYMPSRAEEKVKMTRIRKRTAQRLKESQNTAAFLTTFNEVDMSRLLDFRKKNKEAVLEKHGVKLGMMGSMARASVLALKEIPAANASIENDDIVYRDYIDLSVAASIPKGLVTPVLRNIESMSILQIEQGIAELVKKARDGKLTMDDLNGGSFTISNSGIWGSLFGTPIINLPQTAVLGTYGIQDRPIAVNGQVEIRPMMYVALTYDHRIIDGREAVKFLVLIKNYLETPETMLLDL
ncbi:unnamed protein product [Penicillium olsonii]|nr:unnamed protein product [Penicillium olsonii]